MGAATVIQPSPFDSAQYALPVGRIELSQASELESALAQARALGLAVAFLRVDEQETHLIQALTARGLSPLEVLVTSTLAPDAPVPRVRTDVTVEHHDALGQGADLDAVLQLTRDNTWISHLHADPRLPPDGARRLFEAWAKNDVTGRAQRTILARHEGEVVGYVTVLVRDGVARIDLIAVRTSAQGGGIGGALLGAFAEWVRAEGLTGCVGTQSTNRVLRLYERFGFVPTERHLTYHVWLDTD